MRKIILSIIVLSFFSCNTVNKWYPPRLHYKAYFHRDSSLLKTDFTIMTEAIYRGKKCPEGMLQYHEFDTFRFCENDSVCYAIGAWTNFIGDLFGGRCVGVELTIGDTIRLYPEASLVHQPSTLKYRFYYDSLFIVSDNLPSIHFYFKEIPQ